MSWLEKIGILTIQHPNITTLIFTLALLTITLAGVFVFSRCTQRKCSDGYIGAFLIVPMVGPFIGLIAISLIAVNHFYEIKTFPVLSYSEQVKYQDGRGRFVKYRDHGVQRKEFVYSKAIDTEEDFSKPNKAILKKYVTKPQYRTAGLPTIVQDHTIINKTKPLKWTKASE